MHRSLIAAALTLAALPLSTPGLAADAPAATTTLTVAYSGVATPSGNIMIALYDAAGWDGGKPVRVAMIDAGGKDLSTVFAGLAPGRYAIKSFHDLDGDGKMGTNPFGMPTEPFAFSNNALGAKGPPSFDQAAFDVAAAGTVARITIR